MKLKLTKGVVKEAIAICAIAASAEYPPTDVDKIVLELEADPWSGDLADEAWSTVTMRPGPEGAREMWAEAEALLRSGWTPKNVTMNEHPRDPHEQRRSQDPPLVRFTDLSGTSDL